jgi:hypothetical protein
MGLSLIFASVHGTTTLSITALIIKGVHATVSIKGFHVTISIKGTHVTLSINETVSINDISRNGSQQK